MQERQLINRDEEHLRILSLLYYIFGAIHGFFAFFPLLYVGIGIIMLKIPSSEFNKGVDPRSTASPEVIGGLFIAVGLIFFALILLFALGCIFSGLWLKQRKHRWFTFMIAGFNCLSIPFGTVLGVFTFIVLGRSSVKEMFNKPIGSPSQSAIEQNID